MIVKHFKLSQPEKDRLIRIKAKTGIQNWNVLCRWALCWSLAEPSIPGGVDPLSDSNVEMDWSTFAGEYSEIYEAIIRQRCINDGLGDDEKTQLPPRGSLAARRSLPGSIQPNTQVPNLAGGYYPPLQETVRNLGTRKRNHTSGGRHGSIVSFSGGNPAYSRAFPPRRGIFPGGG